MTANLLEELRAAARAHGDESEADHEVGGVLASCWELLTPDQQRDVYCQHEDLVADWLRAR